VDGPGLDKRDIARYQWTDHVWWPQLVLSSHRVFQQQRYVVFKPASDTGTLYNKTSRVLFMFSA